MKTKITNEMLAKYFSGNCSDQEKQEVEHWKEISEDNSRVFEEMKAFWRNAFITNTYNPDTKASLYKINSKLGFFNKVKAPDSKGIDFPVHRFILRAAAILLIICAGYWFFHLYTETTKNQVLYSASEINEKKNVILPDSSVSEYNPDFSYLWTRNKIKYLDDYTKFYFGDENYRQQSNKEIIGINKEVSEPGLKNNLITQDSSSIAVDSIIRNKSHESDIEKQPLPLPESISNLAVAENNMESVMGTTVEDMLQGRLGNVDITSVPGVLSNVRMGASSGSVKNNPLIVVNGIPYLVDVENLDFQNIHNYINVSREDIETFEILKDSATISKYGAAATYGVINIKTKDGIMKSGRPETVEEMLQRRLGIVDISSESGDPGAGLNIRSLGVENSLLIVVNGIPFKAVYAKTDLENIYNLINVSPEEIESIEVLKDAATISKYGPAAAYGVINIKTKDGKTEK